jgi:sRNA-binding regulator protein Hfq
MAAMEARAQELHKTAGIPMDLAKQVALGRLDLNEVLKQLAFRDEVAALMARHGLDRALATQVTLGQADLEKVLRRKRVDAQLAANRERDILESAKGSGHELVLGVHGRQLLHARVLATTPYEVAYHDLELGTDGTVHKTRLKFAAEAAAWPKARKAMTWDAARKARVVEPILRPQDRFGCSNRRLGEALDRKLEVTVTLLEGEIFVGHIAWVARWEFGLHTKGGDVSIFRHAIDDFVGDQ